MSDFGEYISKTDLLFEIVSTLNDLDGRLSELNRMSHKTEEVLGRIRVLGQTRSNLLQTLNDLTRGQ